MTLEEWLCFASSNHSLCNSSIAVIKLSKHDARALSGLKERWGIFVFALVELLYMIWKEWIKGCFHIFLL